MNIKYLDNLFRYKVEAEQMLEKLKEKRKVPFIQQHTEMENSIYELEVKNVEENLNRFTNLINLYIFSHGGFDHSQPY